PRPLAAAIGFGRQEMDIASPIRRRSGRFHSVAPHGYAAAGWSGSTLRSRSVCHNLDESRLGPAAQPLTQSCRTRFETASYRGQCGLWSTFALGFGFGNLAWGSEA